MGPPRAAPPAAPIEGGKRLSTLDQIQQLERERETRRNAAAERKADRAAEEKRHAAAGLVGDVDFMRAIRHYRDESSNDAREHTAPGDTKVCD